MNTKSILLPSLALAGVCMGFSLTSCDEETREQLIGNAIGSIINISQLDSTTVLAGTWLCTDGTTNDTIYLGTNGSYREGFEDDSLGYYEIGTYKYYPKMYGQMEVKTNKLVYFKNEGKPIYYNTPDYNAYYIVAVDHSKLLDFINNIVGSKRQITLTQLDPANGDTLSIMTYQAIQ